jgi:hypothetical protein
MNPPSFRATVAALAAGQLVCWAALYYAFSSFVLPMQRAFGWSKPQMMGAFTRGPVAPCSLLRSRLSVAQKRLLSVIVSFSRFIWKRVRKLLPSRMNSICAGTTIASMS